MDPVLPNQDINEAKNAEISSLKKKNAELESQLEEAKKLIQKHVMEVSEVDQLKMKSADTLTKAKLVIFENTKVIKNQELQIEALNQQVESLRDVVKITKELLEIRNLEVDQLESKIHCMEEKYKAEKERQDLMHRRLEQMIRHNGELKREYEAQLCLFQALRERYDERELAKGVVDTLKADIKNDKEKLNTQENQSNQEINAPKEENSVTSEEKVLNGSGSTEENVQQPSIDATTETTEKTPDGENIICNNNEVVVNGFANVPNIIQNEVNESNVI